ncbi:MAG: hypothetical protein Q7S92_02240 [Candidatus Diapherotrites archaeon]|nr:hypothetical protein [Candidatus Diapherotrites archaeon]
MPAGRVRPKGKPVLTPKRTTRHLDVKKLRANRVPKRYASQVAITATNLVKSVKGDLRIINLGRVKAIARTNGVQVRDLIDALKTKFGVEVK